MPNTPKSLSEILFGGNTTTPMQVDATGTHPSDPEGLNTAPNPGLVNFRGRQISSGLAPHAQHLTDNLGLSLTGGWRSPERNQELVDDPRYDAAVNSWHMSDADAGALDFQGSEEAMSIAREWALSNGAREALIHGRGDKRHLHVAWDSIAPIDPPRSHITDGAVIPMRGLDRFAGHSQMDPSQYPHLSSVNIFDRTLRNTNAANQPLYSKLWGSLVQGGAEITAGISELVGFGGEVLSLNYFDFYSGATNEFTRFGQALTEAAQGIREWGQTAAPIFTGESLDDGISGVRFGSSSSGVWTYLFSNAPTVLSTIPYMVMGFGAGAVGRGASQAIARGALKAAGRSSMAATISPITAWSGAAGGTVAAAVSQRQMENFANASGHMHQFIERMEAENEERIANGLDPLYTREQIQEAAAEGAREVIAFGNYNMAFDIAQYAMLFRPSVFRQSPQMAGLSNITPGRNRLLDRYAEASQRGGRAATHTPQKPGITAAEGLRIVGFETITEGAEEFLQEAYASRGEEISSAALTGKVDYGSRMRSILDSFSNPEAYEAGIWGAVGGFIFGSIGTAFRNKLYLNDNHRQQALIDQLSQRLAMWNAKIKEVHEEGKYPNIAELQRDIFSEGAIVDMYVQALESDTLIYDKDLLYAISKMTNEELAAEGLPESARDQANTYYNSLLELENIHKSYIGSDITNHGRNKVERGNLIFAGTQHQFFINKVEGYISTLESQIDAIESDPVESRLHGDRLESLKEALEGAKEKLNERTGMLDALFTEEGAREYLDELKEKADKFNTNTRNNAKENSDSSQAESNSISKQTVENSTRPKPQNKETESEREESQREDNATEDFSANKDYSAPEGDPYDESWGSRTDEFQGINEEQEQIARDIAMEEAKREQEFLDMVKEEGEVIDPNEILSELPPQDAESPLPSPPAPVEGSQVSDPKDETRTNGGEIVNDKEGDQTANDPNEFRESNPIDDLESAKKSTMQSSDGTGQPPVNDPPITEPVSKKWKDKFWRMLAYNQNVPVFRALVKFINKVGSDAVNMRLRATIDLSSGPVEYAKYDPSTVRLLKHPETRIVEDADGNFFLVNPNRDGSFTERVVDISQSTEEQDRALIEGEEQAEFQVGDEVTYKGNTYTVSNITDTGKVSIKREGARTVTVNPENIERTSPYEEIVSPTTQEVVAKLKADKARALEQHGRQTLSRLFSGLSKSKLYRDIAKYVAQIGESGFDLSQQEKNAVRDKLNELRRQGFVLIPSKPILTGIAGKDFFVSASKNWNGEILTQKQVEALENILSRIEKGKAEVSSIIVPKYHSYGVSRRGSRVIPPTVEATRFNSVEDIKRVIKVSRENNFQRPSPREAIERKYDSLIEQAESGFDVVSTIETGTVHITRPEGSPNPIRMPFDPGTLPIRMTFVDNNGQNITENVDGVQEDAFGYYHTTASLRDANSQQKAQHNRRRARIFNDNRAGNVVVSKVEEVGTGVRKKGDSDVTYQTRPRNSVRRLFEISTPEDNPRFMTSNSHGEILNWDGSDVADAYSGNETGEPVAGRIYITVDTDTGQKVAIKLNRETVSEGQANLLYHLFSTFLSVRDVRSGDSFISLSEEQAKELGIPGAIEGNVADIIALLVYDSAVRADANLNSDDPRKRESALSIGKGQLRLGRMVFNMSNIKSPEAKAAIIQHLQEHIIINVVPSALNRTIGDAGLRFSSDITLFGKTYNEGDSYNDLVLDLNAVTTDIPADANRVLVQRDIVHSHPVPQGKEEFQTAQTKEESFDPTPAANNQFIANEDSRGVVEESEVDPIPSDIREQTPPPRPPQTPPAEQVTEIDPNLETEMFPEPSVAEDDFGTESVDDDGDWGTSEDFDERFLGTDQSTTQQPPSGDAIDEFFFETFIGEDPIGDSTSLDIVNSELYNMTVEEQAEWLKERFPDFEVTIVDNLIEVSKNGRQAFGMMKDGAITLSMAANTPGVGFHEGFHKAFLGFLTREERVGVLREAENSNLTQDSVYQAARDKGYSHERALEEVLAEHFRMYILTDGKIKLPYGPKTDGFFSKLWGIIKSFLGLETRSNIIELFETIERGGFRHANENAYRAEPKQESSAEIQRIEGQLDSIPDNLITEIEKQQILEYAENFESPILVFTGLDGKKTLEGDKISVHSVKGVIWGSESYRDSSTYARTTGRVAIRVVEGSGKETVSVIKDREMNLVDLRQAESELIIASPATVVELVTTDSTTRDPHIVVKESAPILGTLNPNSMIEITSPEFRTTLEGRLRGVDESQLVTYDTEAGQITYVREPNGDITMVRDLSDNRDSQVEGLVEDDTRFMEADGQAESQEQDVEITEGIEDIINSSPFNAEESRRVLNSLMRLAFVMAGVNHSPDLRNLGRDLLSEKRRAAALVKAKELETRGRIANAKEIDRQMQIVEQNRNNGYHLRANLERAINRLIVNLNNSGNAQASKLWQDVIDNMDIFLSHDGQSGLLIHKFADVGIRTKKGEETLEVDSENVPSDLRGHTLAAYEISARDRAPAALKLFLSTTVRLNESYIEDALNGATKIDPKKHYVYDPITGLPELNEFSELFYSLQDMLVGITEYTTNEGVIITAREQIMNKLAEYAKSDPNVMFIYQVMNDPNTKDQFKSQFHAAFRMINQNFHSDVWDGKGRFTNLNSSSDSQQRRLLKQWDDSFLRSPLFTKEGFNEQFLRSMLNTWVNIGNVAREMINKNKVIEEDVIDRTIQEAVRSLNELGIEISEQALHHYYKSNPENGRIELGRLLNDVALKFFGAKRNSTQKGALQMLLHENSGLTAQSLRDNPASTKWAIQRLANLQTAIEPDISERSVLGAGSKTLYTISQFNYLYDVVSQLANRDSNILGKLMGEEGSSTMVSRSILLKKLKEKPELRDKIEFISVNMLQRKGDKGISPTDTAPSDELIRRMNWVLRGVTQFGPIYPTLNPSDKSEAKGLKLPGDVFFENTFAFSKDGRMIPSQKTSAIDHLTDMLLGEVAFMARIHNEIIGKIEGDTSWRYLYPDSVEHYNAWREAGSPTDWGNIGNGSKLHLFPDFEFNRLRNSDNRNNEYAIAELLYDDFGVPKGSVDVTTAKKIIRPFMFNIIKTRIYEEIVNLENMEIIGVTHEEFFNLNDVPASVKRNRYYKKDVAKAALANKFIGEGSPNSSTNEYRKAAGPMANMGRYNPNDVVFISAEGNRAVRIRPNFAEIALAMDAGAILITDTADHRKRDWNVGEREVAEYLSNNGYIEKDPGVWVPQNREFVPDISPLDAPRRKRYNLKNEGVIDNDIVESYNENYKENAALAMAADFTLNSIIANIDTLLLFHGEPAYYKNIEDLWKRAGAPTAYGATLDSNAKYAKRNFNVQVIQTEGHFGTENQKTEAYEVYKEFFKTTLKADTRRNLTDAQIENLAERMAIPYNNVDATDAQGYITIHRYREIMDGLGRWGEDYDAVFDKIVNEEEVSPEEMKLFMQPLKGVVYGKDGKGRPVYIKYSQAVLFPKLVEGSPKLRALYDKMVETNTDEVVYDTAAKVGGRDPVSLDDFISGQRSSTFVLPNSIWRLQVENPTKGPKEMNKGTQQAKNILSLDRTYTDYMFYDQKMDGDELADMIDGVYAGLSDMGWDNITAEWGLSKDASSGAWKIQDRAKFARVMSESLGRQGYSPSDIQNIVSTIEVGRTLSTKSQRIALQSMMLAAVRNQSIKAGGLGGGYTQMSGFAFTKPRKLSEEFEDTSVEGIEAEGGRIFNREGLHPPMYRDGKFIPGGVLLPAWFAKKIPGIETWTNEEIKEYFKENPEILDIIGFRIPNQAKASIDVLEVAGFLPESAGDTIIMYDDITAKAGSDFDIDKIYAMLPYTYEDSKGNLKVIRWLDPTDSKNLTELHRRNAIGGDMTLGQFSRFIEDNKNSEGKISPNIAAKINGKEASANALIQLYKTAYNAPNTALEAFTPIDVATGLLKEVGNTIEGKTKDITNPSKNTSLNIMTPSQQLRLKETFQGGRALVGAVANYLSDLSYSIGKDIHFNNSATTGILRSLGISYNEISKDVINMSGIVSADGYMILDILSGILNGAVDVARDTWLSKMGLTLHTANVAMFLLRAGVPPIEVFTFLKQPIIQDFVNISAAYEGQMIDTQYDELGRPMGSFDKTMDKWITKAAFTPIDDSSIPGTKGSTLDSLTEQKNNFAYYTNQIKILNYYNILSQSAKVFRDSVISSKYDTEVVSYNVPRVAMYNEFVDQLSQDARVEGYDNKFADGTSLGQYLNVARIIAGDHNKGVPGIFSDMFMEATPSFIKYIINSLGELGYNEITDRNLELVDDLVSRTLAQVFLSASAIPKGENLAALLHETKAREMGRPHGNMLNTFMHFRSDPRLEGNGIINFLIPDRGKITKSPMDNLDFLKGKSSTLDHGDIQVLKEDWKKLLFHEDADIREFANDLAGYAIITSGMRKGLFTFYNLIPDEWFEISGFNDEVNDSFVEMKRGEYGRFKNILSNVASQHWEDSRIVKEVKNLGRDLLGNKFIIRDSAKNPIAFILKSDSAPKNPLDDSARFIKLSDDTSPYIYELVEYRSMPGHKGYNPMYVAIGKLGHRDSRGYQIYESGEYPSFLRTRKPAASIVPRTLFEEKGYDVVDVSMETYTPFTGRRENNIHSMYLNFAKAWRNETLPRMREIREETIEDRVQRRKENCEIRGV